jgi:hypothetical protein
MSPCLRFEVAARAPVFRLSRGGPNGGAQPFAWVLTCAGASR